jgi:hypothetical protein
MAIQPSRPERNDSTIDIPSINPPRRTTISRRLFRLLFLFVVVPYIGVHILLIVAQRQMIFVPTKTEPLSATLVQLPGVTVRNVSLTTPDELKLHGWLYHKADAVDDDINPSPNLLIYFPGNSGTRQGRIDDSVEFVRLGYQGLLFDYRGYSENPGSPSEAGFASDATAVWDYATRELKFPPEQITLFGESMGGGVATRLAMERSVAGTPPEALILNSTYASIPATVLAHYPALPLLPYFVWDCFPSIDRIGQVTCPLLQFHCTEDDITPYAHAKQLFAAAPEKSASGVAKQFVTTEGGQHNFIPPETMRQAIRELQARIDQPVQ